MAKGSWTRLLAIIAAACTGAAGVIAALGAAIVGIITAVADANARRTNVEIDRRLDAIEVRVNGDFGLKLETKARLEKESEVADELGRIRDRLRKLERD